MAMAWDIKEANKVFTAILHVETTTIAWAFGFRQLQLPGPVVPYTGMPYDHARNAAAMNAIESGCEYLFFLDSDVIPPPDAVPRLIARRQLIISGIYARRSPPVSYPVMMRNGQFVTNYPPNAVIDVDVVGCGCCLIHRSVLEKLPPIRPDIGKHWFSWQVDQKDFVEPHMATSEDYTFNHWCRKHGIPISVDTSIVCKHIGFSECTPGNMQPLNTGRI